MKSTIDKKTIETQDWETKYKDTKDNLDKIQSSKNELEIVMQIFEFYLFNYNFSWNIYKLFE